MKRLLVGTILAVPLVFAAPAVSAQVPPPTLTGETLTGTTTTTTSSDCNPEGTSTFSYATSGIASGPYNGTFTETGTVTIGPQPLVPGVFSAPGGLVTTWTATFTITSTVPAATITGTKSLVGPPPGPDVGGTCENGTRGIPGAPPFPNQQFAGNLTSNQLLAYTATITMDGAEFRDTGTSRAVVSVLPNATPLATFFGETYTSDQVATVPLCDEDAQNNQDQGGNDQGCANP